MVDMWANDLGTQSFAGFSSGQKPLLAVQLARGVVENDLDSWVFSLLLSALERVSRSVSRLGAGQRHRLTIGAQWRGGME